MINLYQYYTDPKVLTSPRTNPAWLYRYAQIVGKLSPEQELIIAKVGQYAYYYAINVLRDRFLTGEDAMRRYCNFAQELTYKEVSGTYLYDY
jgi:hypothetical protein